MMKGVVTKAESTHDGLRKGSVWFQGIDIDWKKSRGSLGTFMDVKLYPDPDESN
jgi:hypothetical protein